jgi:hypothetical protein
LKLHKPKARKQGGFTRRRAAPERPKEASCLPPALEGHHLLIERHHQVRAAKSRSSAPVASKYITVVDSDVWPIQRIIKLGGTLLPAACIPKP